MRIKELDGLRGIAVLAVVQHHYLSWLPITGAAYGGLGVNLFFVLSGFLISSILLELRDMRHYFSVFYSRRVLRIFPPYYFGIAVYFCISFALSRPGTPATWLSCIFYYSSLMLGTPHIANGAAIGLPLVVAFGLGVTWSLSVEEVYYTIWAPIVRFTSEKGLAAILLAMMIAAPTARYWWQDVQGHNGMNFYCQMDGLAYGSAVALLIRHRSLARVAWLSRDRLFDWLTLAFIPFTVAFWALGRVPRHHSALGVLFANVCFAFVVHAAVRRSGQSHIWLRLLRAKWLRSVGTVSYSLYLFHYPLLIASEQVIAGLHLPRRVAAVGVDLLGFAMSLAVAYGLWYGMESRILRWKDRMVPSAAHLAPA
jgi:peptidoglycan/LPS O-acetylase OafA/YrhL